MTRERRSSLVVQGVSGVAHAIAHMYILLFATVVLVLEHEWAMSYDSLLALSIPMAVLFGAAALPAGWLADRWSPTGMIGVYFFGLGAATMLTGFADGPVGLLLGLSAMGLFAAIYHPVGIPWLIAHAPQRGRALGLNGVFGSFGMAAAAIVAGGLAAAFGWRAAFVVPGALCLACGGRRLHRRAPRRLDRPPRRPIAGGARTPRDRHEARVRRARRHRDVRRDDLSNHRLRPAQDLRRAPRKLARRQCAGDRRPGHLRLSRQQPGAGPRRRIGGSLQPAQRLYRDAVPPGAGARGGDGAVRTRSRRRRHADGGPQHRRSAGRKRAARAVHPHQMAGGAPSASNSCSPSASRLSGWR